MERRILEMLSNRCFALTLLGCRPSARKSLGRAQKRFQLLTKSSFWSLHHDNNHCQPDCLKQTVYWTFRILVDTWKEVLTRWLSSRAMCCVPSRSGSWSQCLHLPQLGVVNPHMNYNSCNALIILQDRGYLRRNIKNTSTRETVSVHVTFS